MPGFFADSRDRAQRVTACPEIHPRPKRGRSCFSRISDPLDRRHGFSSVVPAKGLSLDPLRSTAQALAAATWDAETIVTKEEVEKLVTNLTRACHKLQLTKGLKASYGGVDFTSFCPACPRPVHERYGYGEWCEYCYHEVRPQEVQSSRCSACRQLVNDELGFGEWCSSCFHEVRPLIYQSAGL